MTESSLDAGSPTPAREPGRATRPPLRELARRGAGSAAALRALAGRPLPVTGLGAAVLCYHDVATAATPTDYLVDPARFRAQLESMLGWGLRFVSLDEVIDRLEGGGDTLDGLAAVTFDDALLGVLEHAVPVLTDLGIPATVFACSAVRGVTPPFWPGAQRTLDAGELRALVDAGVAIGSHTRTHASLTDVDDATLAAELTESRTELGEIAGAPVDLLAYPYGHQDARVRDGARAAGYRAATTFTFGRTTRGTDRWSIPRFCMGATHTRLRLAYHLARPPHAW